MTRQPPGFILDFGEYVSPSPVSYDTAEISAWSQAIGFLPREPRHPIVQRKPEPSPRHVVRAAKKAIRKAKLAKQARRRNRRKGA